MANCFAIVVLLLMSACGFQADSSARPDASATNAPLMAAVSPDPEPEAEPPFPDLQAEFTDSRFSSTTSPIGTFDFLQYRFPLPRGWQNPDNSDIELTNGKVDAVSGTAAEDVSDEEKARLRAERRIGMSHVATRYFDATGDGQDEAIIILKIETTGNAIPQVVYIYEWKDDKPELIWHFRTGDRSDGGLKDIRPEDGELVVELYGQDRFLLGEVETGKITGDEVQLCCPTFFTRTSYKWNGRHFLRQGDRLTFAVGDLTAPPLVNFGDTMNDPVKSKKYLDSLQKPAN